MRTGLTVPEYLHPAYSLVIAAFVLLLTFLAGPAVDFPGLYVVPILFAAWYGGLKWGLPMCLIVFSRLVMALEWGLPDLFMITVQAMVRATVYVPIALWIATASASQRALRREVEMLHGLLPICSYCKKIRDGGGNWQPVEKYIADRSEATFTHGICEACLHEQEELWRKSS